MNDPVLAKYSPALLADQASAPILLIHGKDDTVVPFQQSVEMADALKKAGKPVELVVQDHADHWLSLGGTRLQMLQATMAFVEKHNPPQ
jgi:dipeptidyl aminopeptidase/acylaminoacyl peptidase